MSKLEQDCERNLSRSKRAALSLLLSVFIPFCGGCATYETLSYLGKPQQSFGQMYRMTNARKDIKDYRNVRTQFINYAQARDTENLLTMVIPSSVPKEKLSFYFEKEIVPFFSDFKEAIGNVTAFVKGPDGNPGNTLYEFIRTTNGEIKPHAITIIEQNEEFAVADIVVNKFFPNHKRQREIMKQIKQSKKASSTD